MQKLVTENNNIYIYIYIYIGMKSSDICKRKTMYVVQY